LGGLLVFLGGVLSSIIAAVLVGPIFELLARYYVIRFLSVAQTKASGHFGRWITANRVFDQDWEQCWRVESEHFPSQNRSAINLYQFGPYLVANFKIPTVSGTLLEYRVAATIGRENIVTGLWKDPRKAGYFGPFQMVISPEGDEAAGTWSGFASNNSIKCGDWVWKRVGAISPAG
jgi:hypothetical protein